MARFGRRLPPRIDPRERRLPLWAQEELSQLRGQLEQANLAVDDLNAALGYDDKGETFCGIAVIPGQDDISLPGKVRSIDFTIAEETWSVTPTAEGLRVMHLGHRTRLAVLPHITNMIEILSVEN